ncbi:MAG TPA: hypothetical protein VN132_11090, partial [Bdellovibrio sp.]|nr:hypothetical protein [Bdellovibrio sp.]
MPFAFFLLTMLSSISVFAALGTNANSAMLFYRSRESLFPSGQASRNELENKQLSTEIEFSYRVAWDKRSFSIEAEDLLRDIQTAHYADTKSDYPLLSEKRRDSRTIKKLAAKTSLEILNADSYWAEVKEKNGTATGWIPLHLLQAHNEDLGVYVSLMDTYLRKKPEIPSGIVTTVPRLRRVIPLSIENGFLK